MKTIFRRRFVDNLQKFLALPPRFLAMMTLCMVYLAIAWLWLPAAALWSPDEGAKLWQMQSLRWENGFAYDLQYAGKSLDAALEFAQPQARGDLLTIREGKIYFQRLPIFPLLSLPLYDFFGMPALYVLPALAGAAIGFLMFEWLEAPDRRPGAWLLIAFASPVFIYSILFWEHTLATALNLAGAVAMLSFATARPRLNTWAAAALFGAGFYLRQETIFFSAAFLAAYWLLFPAARRRAFGIAVVLGLFLLPYNFLHQVMFGGQSLPDNARYVFYPFSYLRRAGWNAIPELLTGSPTHEAIATGWLGVVWAAAALLAIGTSLFSQARRWAKWLECAALSVSAIAAASFLFTNLSYRSAHGLLFTTPWALVGLIESRAAWQNGNQRLRLLILTALLGLSGYVISLVGLRASSPEGGMEWGSRFAMSFYPLLAILAYRKERPLDNSSLSPGDRLVADIRSGAVGILLILGFGFQLRGLWTIRHDKLINAALNQAIAASPAPAIVTDLWWLPLNAAPLKTEKPIFVVKDFASLARWSVMLSPQSITSFTLVTLNPTFIPEPAQQPGQSQMLIQSQQSIEALWIQQVQAAPR